ncbi:MAG: GAF domain-containing sensor histidine kinase [Myxococcales bacterium]|nr:GAF domain-containing sensor histidine kinase [Myxococcales bacterium]
MSDRAAPAPPPPGDDRVMLAAALLQERKKLELVTEVGAALSATPDLDQLLQLLIDKVTELMDADRSTLYLLSEDGRELWSKVVQGRDTLEIRLQVGEGIAGWVAASGEVVNIADAYRDTRFQPAVDLRSGYRTRSILCVPMRNRAGAVVGVVQVLNKRAPALAERRTDDDVSATMALFSSFSRDDEELLLALASQTAVVIDNSKLYLSVVAKNAELARTTALLAARSHELNVLYEVEKELSAATDLDGSLVRILGRAVDLLGAEAGSIALLTAAGDALELRTVLGPAAERLRDAKIGLGQGLLGWAVARREPVIANQVDGDARFARDFAEAHGVAARALMAAPVLDGERVVGGIEILDKRAGDFDEADLRLLVLVAGQVGQAISLARSRDETRDQDRLASIGRLMAGVLHDLKTPMTVISGYAQLMAGCDDAAQRERYVENILRQFDTMSGMTREVLAFARGDRDLMIRRVYMHKFIAEAVAQLRQAFAGRPIAIEVDLGYDGVSHFDETKILRVLHNLARNSADAMEDGGHFWVRTRLDGEQLVIETADDGPGIPAALRGRLFELFASGRKGGTGLGLAIVKKIVDDHGGSITCDTSAAGTTFTIRLPHRGSRTGEFAPIR